MKWSDDKTMSTLFLIQLVSCMYCLWNKKNKTINCWAILINYIPFCLCGTFGNIKIISSIENGIKKYMVSHIQHIYSQDKPRQNHKVLYIYSKTTFSGRTQRLFTSAIEKKTRYSSKVWDDTVNKKKVTNQHRICQIEINYIRIFTLN